MRSVALPCSGSGDAVCCDDRREYHLRKRAALQSFTKVAVVFSSVGLRRKHRVRKSAAEVILHGGHLESPAGSSRERERQAGVGGGRRGQCLSHFWHRGIRIKPSMSQGD